MIVKRNIPWFRLLLQFKGSSFLETWPRILLATSIAIIVTFVEVRYGLEEYTLTTTPFTLIGVALGIVLGFRNNASYDRFWEARILWGSLVNTSRSLARQAYSLTSDETNSPELNNFREAFVKRVIAFVHALRHHLRDSDPISDITRFLAPDDLSEVKHSTHRPFFVLHQLGRELAKAKEKRWLPEISVLAIDGQLVELSNIMGACERIKNTPIPFTYTVLIHRIVAFYCFFLPFGLIATAGILTPIVVFLISHAFFGLDAIGDEIGEPFGTLPNNLALSSLSRTIEINLLELINDPNRPEPEAPIDGVLY